MSVFCIDIGNSTIKCGWVTQGETTEARFTETTAIDDPDTGLASVIADLSKNRHRLEGIAWCSVVPVATDKLLAMLRQSCSDTPVIHLNSDHCPGLSINYPKPQEIGQDRLANAIAAQRYYLIPAIVVDMGTAVTFDIVTVKGYEGGIIAPGLELMTRYLNEQTALLPKLDPGDMTVSMSIGKSTVSAMKLGCTIGFDGMIRALLAHVSDGLKKTYGSDITIDVIATGGNADALAQSSLREFVYNPHLSLLGLAEVFDRSCQP